MNTDTTADRTEVRRLSRAVLRQPRDVAAHLARLHAAQQLSGVEPVQGALADLFCSTGPQASSLKAAALQLAAPRLGPHTTRRFEAWVAAAALPRVTPLATRWSVIACVSADVRTRQRRCSLDDSRAVAAQAIAALTQGDLAAQEQFLHHCLTCRDKLAFMLARRQVLQQQRALPASWAAISGELEREGALA